MNNKVILDSWKAISDYLGREIRTCYRWEKELGLPVYRIDKGSMRSKVFAYKSEIDEWLKERAESRKIRWKSFLQNKLIIAGLLSGLVLLSAIFAFFFFYHGKSSPAFSENLTIAVLPFENPNSENFDGYFPEGIANEIIHNITMSSKIKVISKNPIAGLNDNSKTAKQIGKELGADYILKAKMKNDENKIKVFIQLVRTKDEKSILNEEFEGKQEDLSSVSEKICKKINELLNVNPDQKLSLYADERKSDDYLEFENYLREKYELPRLFEDNNDPWNLYWQGKFYAEKDTIESNNLAISLFRKAIDIDGSFALPYIGLANCYGNNVNLGWDFDIKWLDQAEGLLKKAQTLSPNLPEYYATLIKIYLLKYAGFNENTIEAVLELIQEGEKKYPYHSQLNSIIGYYYFLKFGEEGNEADLDRALEYKERSFWADTDKLSNFVFAELLMLKKEFYRAIEICDIVKKYDFSSLAKFRLGEIYYYQGDLDKSEVIFHQFDNAPLRLKLDSMFHLAMIASQRGEKEEALQIVDKVNLLYPEDIIINDYLKLASIYMGIKNKERGYKYLKLFFERQMTKRMRYIFLKYIEIDKNFENLRDEEKFQRIIKNTEE